MYTAYVLTDEAREVLLKKYPVKYSKFIGHHVTVEFGVELGTKPPEPAELKVIGSKDSGDGLQSLVVSVNGNSLRPDGNLNHITWSLEPEKYSAKDSKALLNDGEKNWIISIPITIETVGQLLL